MPSALVSPDTVFTLAVGLVAALAYLSFMWRALQRAIRIRDEADVGEDRFQRSFIGAVVAVIGSASAIAAYGLAPSLLYLGPVLALLSTVAVAFCLRQEGVDG
jgi:uncharacterized membrane protein SpoIIM required for sporulation